MLNLSGLGRKVRIQTTRFNREHGSVLDAWLDMGAPEHILCEDLADSAKDRIRNERGILIARHKSIDFESNSRSTWTLVDISESPFAP